MTMDNLLVITLNQTKLNGRVDTPWRANFTNVNDKCLFCTERETVFHCFLECARLTPHVRLTF